MASEILRPSTCQQIAYDGSTAITNAFGSQTYYVRLVATTAAHFKIGDGAQTAATTDPYLPAAWVEYVKVQPGQRISAIKSATTGTMSVTEMTY